MKVLEIWGNWSSSIVQKWMCPTDGPHPSRVLFLFIQTTKILPLQNHVFLSPCPFCLPLRKIVFFSSHKVMHNKLGFANSICTPIAALSSKNTQLDNGALNDSDIQNLFCTYTPLRRKIQTRFPSLHYVGKLKILVTVVNQ